MIYTKRQILISSTQVREYNTQFLLYLRPFSEISQFPASQLPSRR